ncbi:enoyl-CoA hydratase/isomerase family protein [Labrys monachus]|uniref:Enoyl-CoA hydratase/carnithine racemase n=1 Tax=Labrys monachus TaxID=217067 RepID=A0ABU0F8Q6_9HYPH|nr:enoyl-CoA hydratase/isomerase family protein [Labrys monachus]MDQ0391002.1 enoyl-CoA hydratase/carnithine racemase [Labrys monachus]
MSAPSPGAVRLVFEGEVATLTLDRPAKHNALDAEAVEALRDACRLLDRDRGVRVVILTGSADKAFSAGGDIEAWSRSTPLDFGAFWVREGHEVFDALARLRQPLIAVLNGHAFGGGLELAMVADLRIAEEHVKFGLPEAGLGIIPGWSGTQRAVRRVGAPLIRRMALFGEVLEADEARREGLVDLVVPRHAGLEHARLAAARVCRRAPVATELAKMLINAAEGEEQERVLEALAGTVAMSTEDLKEGVAAFREKRQPHFGGR